MYKLIIKINENINENFIELIIKNLKLSLLITVKRRAIKIIQFGLKLQAKAKYVTARFIRPSLKEIT
jgi:hypothetical protein